MPHEEETHLERQKFLWQPIGRDMPDYLEIKRGITNNTCMTSVKTVRHTLRLINNATR